MNDLNVKQKGLGEMSITKKIQLVSASRKGK